MAGTVSQHQAATFTTPVNATLSDAAVVLANDNAVGAALNAHDADATIHVQSSVLGSRPAAGTAQRVWITTDGLRAYVDSGSAWGELAYLVAAASTTTAASTTIAAGSTTNAFIVTTTGAINTSLRYDASNRLDITVDNAGYVTLNSVGAGAGFTISDALVVSGTASLNGTLDVQGVTTLASIATITGTVTPQLAIRYDGANRLEISISSGGAVTLNAVGGGTTDFTFSDPVTVSGLLTASAALALTGTLTMATAISKIVPGATSWGVRNNADNADNIIITDAGAVTLRGALDIGTNALACGAAALTGVSTVTGTIAPQFAVRYDANNRLDISIGSGGAVTFDSVGGGTPAFTFSDNVAATLSTASQPNVTTMAALVTVGALASGSIASGFGNIDIAGNTLTCGEIATATTFEMYRGATDGRIVAFSRALGATKLGVFINSDTTTLAPIDTFAIANDGTKTFFNRTVFGNDGGLLLVSNITDAQTALFMYNGTTMTEISDPTGTWSVTQGTAASNNLSFVSNVLTLENKRGASKTYTLIMFGN